MGSVNDCDESAIAPLTNRIQRRMNTPLVRYTGPLGELSLNVHGRRVARALYLRGNYAVRNW
jgi:hypothetical protein